MNKFAEHIKKHMGKKATKCARITKKAFTYKDEQAALAKFLNIKEEDLTKNEENFYFGLPEFTTKNGEEYSISASESVIRGAVAESLENLFNDLGLDEFKEKVLPYVGDMERYFSVSESKFYDQAYEELQNVDEIEEPTDEQVEKKQQEIIDSYGSAEEFFIEFGDEYIKEMINHGDAFFDFEKMAEDVIDEYGAGHELSSYDNSTEEVEYNGKTYYIFRQAKKSKKMNKLANIIRREINKSAGSIDYEVMMDIPQNSNVTKEEIIDEIQHLGDTYNLGLDDMYDFQPNHTLTFTLPMEKANKLISELENLGFRLLRREKKDNRTQYEWERDQKIYD